ncbi:MAG: zinc-binding alcohol dehydrogenase [Acidimicrobiia bacterium]|jgi:threonine dehydrogenase-like Zn-dependent dehydrogenase
MKRVFARDGAAVVLDVEGPTLREGEVLIKTAYSAISVGTETWLIDGSGDPQFTNHEYPPDPPSWPKTRTPMELGHPMPRPPTAQMISLGYSLAGEVLAVSDSIVGIEVGDRVAASGSQCAHHAEVVAVPRNLIARVPDPVGLNDAALVTVGSIATTALRSANIQFGETVVLYGLGLLGLLATQIAATAGFNTIGIDVDRSRLELAEQLGLERSLHGESDRLADQVRDLTDGYGADAVILGVKSDSSDPLNNALAMCRQRARVVAQGVFGFNIDRQKFFGNQVELVPAVGYGLGRYDPVYEEGNVDYPIGLGRWTENRNQEYFLGLLAKGRIDTDLIAPVTVPIHDAPRAYAQLRTSDRPPTVLLDYTGE